MASMPICGGLYEQVTSSNQWNAATDIDWEKPLDTDGGLIADDLVGHPRQPVRDRLSPAQRVEINRPVTPGVSRRSDACEHGAMLVVQPDGRECRRPGRQAVPGQPGGRRGAAQRGFAPLHHAAARGETYPHRRQRPGDLRHAARTQAPGYLKTIGLQLVAETFAVSLFRMLADSSKDAILCQICRRILQDEARHMGVWHAVIAGRRRRGRARRERREMEDFAVWR